MCALLIVGCGTKNEDNKKTIYVTITPMQSLLEEITMGDFNVEVIVPKGASPETFEPTPKQVTSFSDAEFIFLVNLDDSSIEGLTIPFEAYRMHFKETFDFGCFARGSIRTISDWSPKASNVKPFERPVS